VFGSALTGFYPGNQPTRKSRDQQWFRLFYLVFRRFFAIEAFIQMGVIISYSSGVLDVGEPKDSCDHWSVQWNRTRVRLADERRRVACVRDSAEGERSGSAAQ
jgi:hypothetical protein